MEFVASSTSVAPNGQVDWPGLKSQILGSLDIQAEYLRLGLEFTGPEGGNRKGIRECRAMGRADERPSAFVNVRTGLYHDSGGEGVTLSFWDFALKYGSFGRWVDVLKHYATRAGVDLGSPHAGKGGKIKEAQYLYRNADGSIRYAVFRYRLPNGKKDFSQTQPDGKGGWRYGEGAMDGVVPLPYQLPEILASAQLGDPIWIVEGEKDADRLTTEGLTATTNHQGANSTDTTWPHFLEHFRDRYCIILPDNDKGGWRHAHAVARYIKPVARSVKVVELPGLGPQRSKHGLDVSDWLDLGHDVEELGRLAFAAPEWIPVADVEAKTAEPTFEKFVGDSGREYKFGLVVRGSSVQPKKIDWLWKDRIPYGFLTLFAGRTKVGKSFVTLDVAARLTVGGLVPLGGGECFDSACCLVISEDPQEYVLAPRLVDAGADMERVCFMRWEAMATFTLGDIEMLNDTYLAAGSPKLIVIDPPTNFLGGKDEHKNAEVRGVLMGVSIWAERHRVAVVMITHCNKGGKKDMAAIDRIIGSIAWASTARIAHIFGPHPDEPNQNVFLPLGSNIGRPVEGMSYSIGEEGGKTVVKWIGNVEIDANEMTSTLPKKPRGVEAVEWLEARFRERRTWSSDELKREAAEAGLSKNALWSPEVKALPIKKRPVVGCNGERHWEWVANDGWPVEQKTKRESGNVGNVETQPVARDDLW